ncbi:methionyl-tRNA formyltransferase [Gluconacetobacter diazotrophicus]|uniref:Methionyl-tRNA formyltransferase n=1 Tax=Gluconacetobacter diazotrophicus (strain ATCC 49037 / DSM 5601 / CCUG 37298 / CIP 103539 / LMG 7603 / PAl5) TaxID=272568 RepID=FMT_GLUDA|nr:methionyl-tRNA formyltransferase [Gluconacetobacter diazotrophicus]A9HKQ4.1 RecName: Full=Methionyl-tRNA formyltransferase [Gluconacetobacter diazotrophicus PA1 5]CAP56071.1 Methionyl-tRNA formyltransferase [Gluconacetobacter diazotrophicus PA1 5]
MRLAFMGTPDFAVPALHALHEAGHEIAVVYSQPPRPAGRGQAVRPQPVHLAAEALGIPVRVPTRLRANHDEHAFFRALDLDAAVVAAYGLILPGAMLTPRAGARLNVHASLLPRWRGAAPIQAAILAGDDESGVTIMQMDEGLDTGAMLLTGRVALTPATTASTLHDDLAAMGGRLIVAALANSETAAIPQPAEGATYAARLTREDGRIDWTRDAVDIDRQVRALTPWPGTFTTLDGTVLKIGAATPIDGPRDAVPGTVLDDRLTVACGQGTLRLTRIQRPGRGMMEADAFLRGQPVPVGTRLGS